MGTPLQAPFVCDPRSLPWPGRSTSGWYWGEVSQDGSWAAGFGSAESSRNEGWNKDVAGRVLFAKAPNRWVSILDSGDMVDYGVVVSCFLKGETMVDKSDKD